MTDKLHYQDVQETNIPNSENDMIQYAEYLLGMGSQGFDISESSHHLRTSIDTPEITQAIWELKNESGKVMRTLAITAMDNYFCIGLDRRPTSEYTVFRGSNLGGITQSEKRDSQFESFRDIFYETVAALGLQHRLERIEPQNESSSAVFANAA